MTKSDTSASCSEILAAFASELSYDNIPSAVTAKVKTHIMDSVGVGMGGSTMKWCRQAAGPLLDLHGPADATALGYSGRISAPGAAMVNGIAISATDYDDTDYGGGGHHMSRSVVPAALAVAEMVGASGKELIAAVTAGYEVTARVGAALMVDRYGSRSASEAWTSDDLAKHHAMQKQGGSLVRGFMSGLYGSAVAAGRLLRLAPAQIASAQGLVGALGLYLGQPHREGTDGLMLYSGWNAHAGILAALWARAGLEGPRFVYEGDRGLLTVIGGELQDASRLTANLGGDWNSMNNLIKFYPAGHGTHHFIESLGSLMREHGLTAGDIAQIECRAPAQRVEFHFLPLEAKLNPTPYTGRFSMPYLLARLALDGDLSPTSFTAEKVAEPAALNLARRITYVADEAAWHGARRGLVHVTLRDGRVLSRSSPDLKGFASRPCTRDDIVNKFTVNAELAVRDKGRLDELVGRLDTLECADNVRDIMELTTPA